MRYVLGRCGWCWPEPIQPSGDGLGSIFLRRGRLGQDAQVKFVPLGADQTFLFGSQHTTARFVPMRAIVESAILAVRGKLGKALLNFCLAQVFQAKRLEAG